MVAGGGAGRGPVMARPASGYGGRGFVTGAPGRSGTAPWDRHYHGFYAGHYPFRFGFRFGYPWRYRWWGYPYGYGGWYAYPVWSSYGNAGWYADAYSYPMPSYPPYDYSYDSYSQLQQNEIDRLNNEVARLQQERQASRPQSQSQPKPSIHGETVLIFRDKHTEEVQKYAIVGKTFWIFNETRARKIPIADLDVPATTKANQDRGIEFSLPK